MSSLEIARKPTGTAPVALMTSFVVATLTSSCLLFLIQPLMARLMLPMFGGSSSVWAVSMTFFQAMLLLGYGYAHVMRRYMPLREGIILHVGLMIVGLLLLRFDVALLIPADAETLGTAALLAVLIKTVGFPFAVMSANAPLTQSWFSKSSHSDANDPYFLYAASNLGSMFALIAYPLLLEPTIGLALQSKLWTIGFGILSGLLAISGLLLLNNLAGNATAETQAQAEHERISWTQRACWLLWAFIPSALLSAWTNHITTDVASAPFLWLPPLALYLLSYVLMFRTNPFPSIGLLRIALLISLPLAYLVIYGLSRNHLALGLTSGAVAFMATTCILHRKMYETRPDSAHLTEFYLIMSIGGVLGGIFVSLLAPILFSGVTEYPLLLIAALVIATTSLQDQVFAWFKARAFPIAILIGLAFASRGLIGTTYFENPDAWRTSILFAVSVAAFSYFFKTNQRFPAYVALIMVVAELIAVKFNALAVERNFYGVLSVRQEANAILMTHGTTIHGAALVTDINDPKRKPTPLTYYTENGGMAQSIIARQQDLALRGEKGKYGVVGLGAGSLACFENPGETWRYFEINPVVVKLAKNPAFFPYLERCAKDPQIIMGDARLTLQKEIAASYDALVIDAFSSDSIPVHLMTVEAMRHYMALLKPGGVLALHVSNRHLELISVVKANIEVLKIEVGLNRLTGILFADRPQKAIFDAGLASSSNVILISREPDSLARHTSSPFVAALPESSVSPWTDDYSNVMASIWRAN